MDQFRSNRQLAPILHFAFCILHSLWPGQTQSNPVKPSQTIFFTLTTTSDSPSGHRHRVQSCPIVLFFMFPALQQCLVLRILCIFAAIQPNRLSMNHLHTKLTHLQPMITKFGWI
jgi:hypothetical protein